ncbi:MAG: MFS transporter [Acidobacteria bacterium]|nr:MFS transporter [Acidobacteriota bacterium]
MADPSAPAKAFPTLFWTANLTEVFERAAYYSMASFVVIYLGQLGFGDTWPSIFNSSILWGLIYFLPILSGTIADDIGFRRGLLLAFVLLGAGYFMMGYPVWLGGSTLTQTIGDQVTASTRDIVLVVAAILLIGIGGSFVKPCISGTVQKTSGTRATLGFAIFYMVINIGSLFGRGTAFVVRSGSSVSTVLMVVAVCTIAAAGLILLVRWATQAHREKHSVWPPVLGYTLIVVAAGVAIAWIFSATASERGATDPRQLSYIFAVAAAAAVVAFFVVLLFYREPARDADKEKRRRSLLEILMGMLLVLGSLRFALFLLVMSGFFFIYNQVYNVLPLYTKKVVETNPAMDLYTAANPFVIVCFQLLITRAFGKMKPIRSMVFGTLIIGAAMLINLAPVYMAGGVRAIALNWLPIASIFIILTVALIALGELFTSARMYEYIGALAPKGQEGLFLGYANLPLALGAMLGGPVGAIIFNDVMAKGAARREDGLLELAPGWNALGWLILMAIGLISAAALWQFNRWVSRPHTGAREAETGARAPATVASIAWPTVGLGVLSLVTAAYALFKGPLGASVIATALVQVGFCALLAAVGLKLLAGRGWARGLFIVALPTLWGLFARSFVLSWVLWACAAVWIVGMLMLTRRSAIAYLGDD